MRAARCSTKPRSARCTLRAGATSPAAPIRCHGSARRCRRHAGDRLTRWQIHDVRTSLHDEMLAKVDRATMACGVEARPPLLDHRLVELAVNLPAALKLRDGRGKWILRQVGERYVPPGLFDRAKAGFTMPLSRWFQREWRDSPRRHARPRRRSAGPGCSSRRRCRRSWPTTRRIPASPPRTWSTPCSASRPGMKSFTEPETSMSPSGVSIVILSYNRLGALKAVLEGLLSQDLGGPRDRADPVQQFTVGRAPALALVRPGSRPSPIRRPQDLQLESQLALPGALYPGHARPA